MESLIEAGVRGLGVRFTLVSLGPTALSVVFILAHFMSGAPGHAPDIGILATRARQMGATEVVAVGVAILGISFILEPLQLRLVQCLEGYWGITILARMARSRTQTYQRRRQTIEQQIAEHAHRERYTEAQELGWQLASLYPAESRMMPTMLGNALRAAEDRPSTRYGLDSVVTWPRLYSLLPETLRGVLDDRRNQLDLAARMCVTLMAMSLASVMLLLTHGPWLIVPAATTALAWLSYRGAVAAAIAYGESVQAAFDLHRFDLLRALHLPLPTTREREKEANRALCDFLRQGVPVDFQYDHPPASAKSE